MAKSRQPIGVIEINTDVVEKRYSVPNTYAFSITLSEKPDSQWKKYFEEEWKKSSYETKRAIKVDGNKLRLTFVLGDNVREHARFAQKLVDTTNQRLF